MKNKLALITHEIKEDITRWELTLELVNKLDLISAKDQCEYSIEEMKNLLTAISEGDKNGNS